MVFNSSINHLINICGSDGLVTLQGKSLWSWFGGNVSRIKTSFGNYIIKCKIEA